MSSTVSCSSAAQSVSVSSRRPAQIFATSTGWLMKSSPERRFWSAWRSQAKTKARSIVARSISGPVSVGVLTDDREEVAEQRPLLVAQVPGDLVDWCGRGSVDMVDADPGVAVGVELARSSARGASSSPTLSGR